MNKLSEVIPVLVKFIPDELEFGKLYISEEFNTAVHLCACGCGGKTITPLINGEWTLTQDGSAVSLTPSIGNWSTKNNTPYHAHYHITKNKIIWC